MHQTFYVRARAYIRGAHTQATNKKTFAVIICNNGSVMAYYIREINGGAERGKREIIKHTDKLKMLSHIDMLLCCRFMRRWQTQIRIYG